MKNIMTGGDSITVNLLANGSIIGSIDVTEADDWQYSFPGLRKYESGEEIVYSITEEAIEGYETTISGYDITNTLIIEDKPIDPTPGKPEEPREQSSKDDKDKDSAVVSVTKDKTDIDRAADSATDGNKLPSTATNMYNMLAIGLGLLIIGIAIAVYYRKRQVN